MRFSESCVIDSVEDPLVAEEIHGTNGRRSCVDRAGRVTVRSLELSL
jgi:hypothetical protein